jgi:hypothetical protein
VPLALLAEYVGLRSALALALTAGPLIAIAICPFLDWTSEMTAGAHPEPGLGA